MNPDLEHWLWLATKGLPPAAAARVREELESHYHEALDWHQRDGADDLHAHRLALDALGDPQAIAQALVEPHASEQDYRRASRVALAVTLLPLLMIALRIAWQPLGFTSYDAPGLLLVLGGLFLCWIGAALHSLHMLRRLLVVRHGLEGAALPIRLAASGVRLGTLVLLIIQAFTILFTVLSQEVLMMITPDSPVGLLLRGVSWGVLAGLFTAMGLFGGGLTLLGLRLRGLWHGLYGLRGGLQNVLVGTGALLCGAALLAALRQIGALIDGVAMMDVVLLILGLLNGLALFPLLSELFRRAAIFDSPDKRKRQTE